MKITNYVDLKKIEVLDNLKNKSFFFFLNQTIKTELIFRCNKFMYYRQQS